MQKQDSQRNAELSCFFLLSAIQSNPYFNYHHHNNIPGNSGRTFTRTRTHARAYIPGENANAVLLPAPRRTRARPRCRAYHSAGKIWVFVILTEKLGGQTVPGVSLTGRRHTVPGVSIAGIFWNVNGAGRVVFCAGWIGGN